MNEFLVIAAIHLLALAWPGPDWLAVTEAAVLHGRRAAIYTACGIAAGLALHVTWSIIGVGVVVTQLHLLLPLQLLAGGYFLYIGVQALCAPPPQPATVNELFIEDWRYFWRGVLVNTANVKAILFFVALFTTVIDRQTPLPTQIGYGVYLVTISLLWFIGVACLFSGGPLRLRLAGRPLLTQRIIGVLFCLIGISVWWAALPA